MGSEDSTNSEETDKEHYKPREADVSASQGYEIGVHREWETGEVAL